MLCWQANIMMVMHFGHQNTHSVGIQWTLDHIEILLPNLPMRYEQTLQWNLVFTIRCKINRISPFNYYFHSDWNFLIFSFEWFNPMYMSDKAKSFGDNQFVMNKVSILLCVNHSVSHRWRLWLLQIGTKTNIWNFCKSNFRYIQKWPSL